MEAYMSTYINSPTYTDTNTTITFTPFDIGIAFGAMILGIGMGTMFVKSYDKDCLNLEELTSKRNKYREDWDNYLENRDR